MAYINKADAIEAVLGDEYDLMRLSELPTIDIVTCGECKHRGQHMLYQEVLVDNWCEIQGKIMAEPHWFCADGERKSDEKVHPQK